MDVDRLLLEFLNSREFKFNITDNITEFKEYKENFENLLYNYILLKFEVRFVLNLIHWILKILN